MPVKESSDELNPAVVTTSTFIAPAPRRWTQGDYAALAIATCGVGYLPVAPGTFGSAVGIGLYLLFNALGVRLFAYGLQRAWSPAMLESLRTSGLLLIVIALTLVGIRAASRAERLMGRKDPGAVVIDEVAGQLITFLFVPFNAGLWAILAGFLAFRAFDIWKPYPIRRLEALESGLGIMADDVLAGAYAATLMSLLISIHMLF